jgi:soluble cytochrome b562
MNTSPNDDFSNLIEAVDEFRAELKAHAGALQELRMKLQELRGIRALSHQKKSIPPCDKPESEPVA